MNPNGSKGQVGARAPWHRPRGRINTLYSSFKNAILSKNLDQNMPKNEVCTVLYRRYESYVSHHPASKHQCTCLGSVPDL